MSYDQIKDTTGAGYSYSAPTGPSYNAGNTIQHYGPPLTPFDPVQDEENEKDPSALSVAYLNVSFSIMAIPF